MRPDLECWHTTPEADVGDVAAEAESPHQFHYILLT